MFMHKPVNGMEGMGFEPLIAVHGIMQLYISQKYTKKYMKGFGLSIVRWGLRVLLQRPS